MSYTEMNDELDTEVADIHDDYLQTKKNKVFRLLSFEQSVKVQIWRGIKVSLIYIQMFLLPYIFFQDFDKIENYYETWTFMDVYFLLDVIFNFFIYTKENQTFLQIAKSYIKYNFWIDLILATPYWYFGLGNYFFLIQLFRYYQVFTKRGNLKQYIQPLIHQFLPNQFLSTISSQIIVFLIQFSIINQIISCYILRKSSWVKVFESKDNSIIADEFAIYINSLYFLYTNYTTVGYGDITPNTNPQRLITCLIQVAGIFMFGYFKNILQEYFNNRITKQQATQRSIDNFIQSIKEKNDQHLDGTTTYALRQKFIYLIQRISNNSRLIKDDNYIQFLDLLPYDLRYEIVNMMIQSDYLDNFFQDFSSYEKYRFKTKMTIEEFIKDEQISQVFRQFDKIYIIFEGTVSFGEKNNLSYELGPGSIIGEAEILFDRLSKYNYKSIQNCKTFIINKNDYLELLEEFPKIQMQNKVRAWIQSYKTDELYNLQNKKQLSEEQAKSIFNENFLQTKLENPNQLINQKEFQSLKDLFKQILDQLEQIRHCQNEDVTHIKKQLLIISTIYELIHQ